MSLFDESSLVMIPSGYKEDVVYSVKPTDGSGDLTFTRASDGTRVNSQGYIERVPWNLAQYSEDLSNGIYALSNGLTVTSNTTTAPNGTLTADTLSGTSSNGSIQGVVGVTIGQVYTMSVYLKRKTGTGTIQLRGVSNTSTTVSITNEWARYSVTLTAADANGRYGVLIQTSGDEVYAWGFQLNEGTLKPYFPTTDRLNVPRLDYSNGCPSLLLEPQRTNLVTYSEDFTQWLNAGGTISGNTTTSPDGTQNADTLTGARYRTGLGTGIFTFSCYAKKVDGDNTFRLRLDVPATIIAIFNLNTGAIISTPSGYSATITPAGNGWYRCTLTSNSSITITNAVVISANSSSNSTYVWGAQVEAGSYATSYIPTTSASVTRVADLAYKGGISSLIGQTEGTLFADFEHSITNTTEDTRFILSDNTYNNWTFFSVENGTSLRYYLTSGGVNQLDTTVTNVFPTAGRYKVALAYEDDLFTIYVNGVQKVNNTTSTNIPAMSTLLLSGKEGVTTAVELVNKQVNQAVLFKTRLTNDQLEYLTGDSYSTYAQMATALNYTIQ